MAMAFNYTDSHSKEVLLLRSFSLLLRHGEQLSPVLVRL